MIDTKISFARVEALSPARNKRMAPLLGLGLGAVVSMALWSALAFTVSHIF